MKLFSSYVVLTILIFLFADDRKKELDITSSDSEAIVITGEIGEVILKTSNGCGIGNFLIPSTGDSTKRMKPLLGSLSDYRGLGYQVLDTIPGTKIKGVVFNKSEWLENTSIVAPGYEEFPYVVISDVGMFSYLIPPKFTAGWNELVYKDTISIPNIQKVAKETTIEMTNTFVLFVEDSTDQYSIQFYTYPELQEKFKLNFHFEPEIFELIEDELFITGLDTNGHQQLYHYNIIEETLPEIYTLNDSLSNAKEIIKSGDLVYILSCPGDSITMLSTINLTSNAVSQFVVHSKSSVRATHNKFKNSDLFTYQIISDTSNYGLDKQILILNPATYDSDTLMINLQLDYFKQPRDMNDRDIGFYFDFEWFGAKWGESSIDSIYIKQEDGEVLKVETGAIPQYISATYDCWPSVEESELEKIEFDLYPNPASSKVIIHLTGLQKGKEYKLNIVDNSGKVLYRNYLTAYHKIELPLHKLANGIYYLQLNTGENMISKKLMIQ